MSLLEIFKQAKLNSTWKYETNGMLWRLLPTTNNLFIGEDRNVETKCVSFFCLDSVSGKVLWNNISFTETWWIGIENVYKNILFLHEFSTPDMPDHKKIFALNIENAQVLWVNEELQFHFAFEMFVYGSKIGFESRKYFRLDMSSGKVVAEISGKEFQELQFQATNSDSGNIIFPKEVNNVDSMNKSFQKVASKVLNTSRPMECIEQNEKLILSYYDSVRNNGNGSDEFEQHVLIADKNGRLLYRDKVNERVKVPVPDTVMLMNGTVYYIKNKKKLIAVRLYE